VNSTRIMGEQQLRKGDRLHFHDTTYVVQIGDSDACEGPNQAIMEGRAVEDTFDFPENRFEAMTPLDLERRFFIGTRKGDRDTSRGGPGCM
jgi:hypothetical protein